jgi:YjbE family integral membrane protein
MAETGGLLAFAEIVLFNLLLSGDNALVIAMAAQKLPTRDRKRVIWWGSGAAVVLRLALTAGAAALLGTPYLPTLGAALLFVVALQLLRGSRKDRPHGGPPQASATLGGAVGTVVTADLVMSLDNVLAVAAVARDNLLLLFAGVAVGIPLVIWGSAALIRLLDRLPWLMVVGGALLAYAAGDLAVDDPAWQSWIATLPEPWVAAAPSLAAALLIAVALPWRRRD